jgi:hypothetical protein
MILTAKSRVKTSATPRRDLGHPTRDVLRNPQHLSGDEPPPDTESAVGTVPGEES